MCAVAQLPSFFSQMQGVQDEFEMKQSGEVSKTMLQAGTAECSEGPSPRARKRESVWSLGESSGGRRGATSMASGGGMTIRAGRGNRAGNDEELGEGAGGRRGGSSPGRSGSYGTKAGRGNRAGNDELGL